MAWARCRSSVWRIGLRHAIVCQAVRVHNSVRSLKIEKGSAIIWVSRFCRLRTRNAGRAAQRAGNPLFYGFGCTEKRGGRDHCEWHQLESLGFVIVFDRCARIVVQPICGERPRPSRIWCNANPLEAFSDASFAGGNFSVLCAAASFFFSPSGCHRKTFEPTRAIAAKPMREAIGRRQIGDVKGPLRVPWGTSTETGFRPFPFLR